MLNCKYQPNQNVLLYLPHRATFVPHLLEPWTATTLLTIAAAEIAFKASHSLASLTRPLGLESGRHHQFARQRAVAAKVSSGTTFTKSSDHLETLDSMPQVLSPHQTTLVDILATLIGQRR